MIRVVEVAGSKLLVRENVECIDWGKSENKVDIDNFQQHDTI